MSRFLFLEFLVSFLAFADAASYTLTGELQLWNPTDVDFGHTGTLDTTANYYSSALNFFGVPSLTGSSYTSVSSASSFALWWNPPTSKQSTLYPYSIVMNDGGTGTYSFSRSGFAPTGASLFSLHFRTELPTTLSATSLAFTSSDDFAIYVDGTLSSSCSQSGFYATAPATKTCTISLQTLGTAPTHFLDVFYARRSTTSPGTLSFVLPLAQVSLCSIFSRTLLNKNIYPFGTGNVQPFINAVFYNDSTGQQPVLQLLGGPSQISTATAVYSSTPIRYINGFSTYFVFNITGGSTTTTEGFTFLIQSYAQSASQGSGSSLGYAFPKSLVVEFDTLPDGATGCDPSAQHIEVHAVLSSSTSNSACRTTANLASTTQGTIPNMLLGVNYEVYIEYSPMSTTAGSGTITAWISPLSTGLAATTFWNSRYPGTFIVQATVSNANLQSMLGNGLVSVGFTTSAGSANSAYIYIWNWRVNTVPIGVFNTQVSPALSSWSTQIARNTKPSTIFTVTLEDACGGAVPYGTDTVTAQLQVSGTNVGSTVVSDNADGAYGIWWWNTLAANYTLYVEVYGQSIVEGVAPSYIDAPFNVVIVPGPISAPNCNYTPSNIGLRAWKASDVINVTIYAYDQFNNPVYTPTTGFQMFFSSQPAITAISQTGNAYVFPLGTTVANTGIKIFARYSGSDIAGSPTATLNVVAGTPADATQTAFTLIGMGLSGSVAGVSQKIEFQLKDQWGNTQASVNGTSLTVSMACVSGYTDPRCANASIVTIVSGPEPGNPSWLEINWTTPVVGPCYTLNISIFPATNNVNLLPGLPNVCVVPNNASGLTSLIEQSPPYTAGTQSVINIQARDAYLNNRTTSSTPAHTVSIGGVMVVCDGSVTTGANVTGLSCSYTQGGIYQASFTPTAAGMQTVQVTLSGQSVSAQINVSAGPAYAPNDNIAGLPATIVAGTTASATFTSYDKYMNQRAYGADLGSFVVSFLPSGASSGSATVGAISSIATALYGVGVTPFSPVGTYYLTVKLLGSNVANSPVSTNVIPSYTNISLSSASGPGVNGGLANNVTSFNITVYDNYGNINNVWSDAMTCQICNPTCGSSPPCSASQSPTDKSSWTITYTVPSYVPGNTNFKLNLSVIANVTIPLQTRIFPMSTSANGNQLAALLYDHRPTTFACPSNFPPFIPLGTILQAGVFRYFYLYDWLSNCTTTGSQAAQNLGVNEPSWSVNFSNGTNKFAGSVLNDSMTTASQAIYNVSAFATIVGYYRVQIFGGSIETLQSQGGVFVTVTPGPLYPPNCIVTPQQVTVQAGTTTSFTVVLRDAYGNNLTSVSTNTLTMKLTDQSANVVTSNASVIYSQTEGTATVTITPTVSGVGSLFIYANDLTASNASQLISSKSVSVTVLAGPVSTPYTCFWGPYNVNTSSCPTPVSVATAGKPYTLVLYARDMYNNPVTDTNLNFTLTLNTNFKTVTSTYTGNFGVYSLTFQANTTISNGTLAALASIPAGLNAANTNMTVQPSDLSSITSYVTGLDHVFVAGDWVNWTLVAKDVYGNAWFSTGALQIEVTLAGPEAATKAVLSVPAKGFIASAALNPGGLYNYQYIPTTASTNTPATGQGPPIVINYTVTFLYNGAPLVNLSGNVPFEVVPAAPDATETIIPNLYSPLIPAGDLTNLTIQLRDVYQNLIRQGGVTSASITFYQGPGSQCTPTGAVDTTKLVSNFTDRRDFIHLEPPYAYDNMDGTWNLTIWTVVAGYYFGDIMVGGNETTPCKDISTVFQITPLDVNGTNSLLTGPVIDDPAENIAGQTLQLNLILRDTYDNLIPVGGQQILIGATPHDNPGICQNDLPWLQNTVNVSNFNLVDNNNGSWQINFQVFRAQIWHLVIVVNTSTVNAEAIGKNCYNLTILPWYVYTWTYTIPGNIDESLNSILQVNAKDKYGNNVTTGAQYWRLVYTRTTVDNLALYAFPARTYAYPYQANYNAEHFGAYSALLTLVQDPLYADQTKYPIGQPSNTAPVSVSAATCARLTNGSDDYRCPDESGASLGTCQASWTSPTCSQISSPQSCSSPGCSGGYCASQCPPSNGLANCPDWALATCASGPGSGTQCRQSTNECPSPRICPSGWQFCNNGRSCTPFSDATGCPVSPSCSGSSCANGACVSGPYDCPTDVTCSDTTSSLCPDGSCVSAGTACPSLFFCFAPTPYRCMDGSCRASQTDCPSGVTCPRGYALCETGQCVQSISVCQMYKTVCSSTEVHCADGSCRDNPLLCPSGITCPANRPVLCADRSCVATVALCRLPASCNNDTLPWLCPDGTCAPAQAQCPTATTCTVDTPVLCEDRTCKSSLAECVPRNMGAPCPRHRPYNCPDGSCAGSLSSCPTVGVCTPDTPVRCSTAACAVAGNVCPLITDVPCPTGVQCPGGGCASALSQCPTPVSCPTGFARCSDGSCRTSCTGIQRTPDTQCEYPYYDCPGHEGGFSCVTDPTTCPQSVSCPADRPVRCVDRSCAISQDFCKPAPSIYASGYTTCAGNTWVQPVAGASGVCPNAPSTSCPFGWVKCWDDTCRHIAEDCPAEALCTVNHPNPRYVQPYLCSSGQCTRDVYLCTPASACPQGTIRCPAIYQPGGGGPSNVTNIQCAATFSLCADITAPAYFLGCALGDNLCKGGACMTTCPQNANAQGPDCPSYLPYLCPSGHCVLSSTHCPGLYPCPPSTKKCWDGSCSDSCPSTVNCGTGLERCPDGSCQSQATCASQDPVSGCPLNGQPNVTRCWDKSCPEVGGTCVEPSVDPLSPINTCPLGKPYLCSNGYCATSSMFCPWLPQPRTCPASYPFLCADGSCQMTGIQCPVIGPCPTGTVRCDGGTCATSADVCPASQRCKAPLDFMCPNGLCAASNETCFNDATGCYGNATKCLDGECSSSCTTPPSWDGCSLGSRCWDGSCATACGTPAALVCNPADPAGFGCASVPSCASGQILCGDGTCAAPTSCKTAWGCAVTTPFRGVDGGCHMYPADGSTSSDTAPSGTVVCPSTRPNVCKDGSCVANSNHCPPVQSCPSGTSLCTDMTCTSSCPTIICPPGSPALCSDGSCRKSARECGSLLQALPCPSPMIQCFDGACVNGTLDCVSRQYQFQGKSYSNGAAHVSDLCSTSGTTLCWNGACVKTATTGTPYGCPPMPGCPLDFPLRCWDGSCINTTTNSCPTFVASSAATTVPSQKCSKSSLTRCEDGTCRLSSQPCPQFAGCPVATPYYCAFGTIQCVVNEAACLYDAANAQVCGDNCYRDAVARSQLVTIPLIYPVTVDVTVDDSYTPLTQIIFAPATLQETDSVVISPSTIAQLQNGRTRINSLLVGRTPGQILLSTPFQIHFNNFASGQLFPLSVTVTAAIDTAAYAASSGSTGVVGLTNPCEWDASWSATGQYGGVNCAYNFNITNTTTFLTQDLGGGNSSAPSPSCPVIAWKGNVYSVVSSTDQTTGNALTCICSNVTSSNGTGSFQFAKGTVVCILYYSVVSSSGETAGGSAIIQTNPSMMNVCPTLTQANGTLSLSMLNTSVPQCTGSGVGLINPNDMCLGYFNPSSTEWICEGPTYAERIANPPWTPASGNPSWRATGELQSVYAGFTYAFLGIPLPAPPFTTTSGESWWQKYGKIVLGVTISMFILLLILICAISRLIRYRKKYHEEKAEAEELREQAQELDEKHGGLGVYDEEVEMIANPLVVEMQELQKQLEQTNAHLKTQEEMDETQMAALDKERQRILEEIKRVKDAIASQAKSTPTRADEIPASSVAVSVGSGGVSASASGGGERQEFGQATARRKKQDL